jgi:hypothetical protein
MPAHIRRNRTQIASWQDNADVKVLRAIAEEQGRSISEVMRYATKLFLRNHALYSLQMPEGRAASQERGHDPDADAETLSQAIAVLSHYAYTPVAIAEADNALALY